MDSGTFCSGAAAIAAWAAIIFGYWQSKKQQKIIDKQNAFLQATTRIDCLNRRKEKLEGIVKEYNTLRDINQKAGIFFTNLQYFIANNCFEKLGKACLEYNSAYEKWGDCPSNAQEEFRQEFNQKTEIYHSEIENMYKEVVQIIVKFQTQIDQLEASLMQE